MTNDVAEDSMETWTMEEAGVPDPDDRVNILIVDDLPENQMVYHSILDECGQNLMTAQSGEDALKLILKHEFAVILMDVNMPGMNGFEIATLIRNRKKSAHTPIIFLTAFTDEMKVAQGYASGAVDYLPTPVVPEILKAKIRVFIELSQMRRKAALQAEERAKRTAAEEADRRKDEFLGMLAHELRNPLGPILNSAQFLQMAGPPDAKLAKARDVIYRQTMHMARLIDDLLDSTRLANGKILLRKERCDLTQIVRQTADDYYSILESSGLHLKIERPEHPIWMEGDPTRLAQIVGNLLHNAHKFTDPGGTVTLRIELDERDHRVSISVEDTGIGIDPEMLPYVFDVFRQAEQGLARSRGGLGLGLTLVKSLVAMHGGMVSAHSEGTGKGAKFVIQLPVEPVAAEVVSMPAPAPAEPHNTKYRILLIEDNLLAAESTQLLLSYDGYDVQTAGTGPLGLETAKSFLPQVILCDIGLPGMDGYSVVRAMRKDPQLASCYVIALTGYGRDEDQDLAREAGFDLHMTKPIDYEYLRRTLGNLPVRAASVAA